jgi:hypothetical protein
LEGLANEAWAAYRRAEETGVAALVRPSIPILFFGDYERYFSSPMRVITVGLNPAASSIASEEKLRADLGAGHTGRHEPAAGASLSSSWSS